MILCVWILSTSKILSKVIHGVACISISFFLYVYMIFHCRYLPQFIYLFIHIWTFVFPVFSFHKESFYEHLSMSLCRCVFMSFGYICSFLVGPVCPGLSFLGWKAFGAKTQAILGKPGQLVTSCCLLWEMYVELYEQLLYCFSKWLYQFAPLPATY